MTPLLAQPKRLALLIYLAGLPAGGYCRRDILLALFWPEADEERGRASLRRSLHFIRRALGEGAVLSRGGDVGVDADAVRFDLRDLYATAAVGDREAAMGFYAGDFLPGFHVESAPAFEEWITSQRAAARGFALETAEALAREAAEAERAGDAVRWARRAVEIAPDEERVVRLLMELLAASGDRTAALDSYRALESRLAAEYGDTPSARTEALAAGLRRSEPRPDDDRVADLLPSPPPPEPRPADGGLAVPPPLPLAPEPRHAWWRKASVLLLVVLLAVAAWLWRTPGETPREEISVAVLPFEVSAGGPYGYLEAGLPVLLSTRLHEAGPLRAIDPSTVLRAWDRRPAGERGDLEIGLGRRLSAALVVRGSVSGAGDSLKILAHLWDVERGRRVASIETTGTERELQGMADRVATRLLAGYLREHGDAWAAAAARTTTSPAALKAWLEGESHLRRGRYGPAVQAFLAATQADSGFALAHYRLALAADWAGEGPRVNIAAARAVARRDRLGPQERLLAEALLASREAKSAIAERLYRQAATSRPSDVEAWLGLAEVLFHRNPAAGRSMDEARPAFEQVLRLDPGNFPSLVHLARLAVLRGDLPLLDRLTRAALRTDPDGGHRAEMLLLRAVALGDREAAMESSALAVNPVTLDALWRTAGYTGNPAAVQAQATLLLRATGSADMRASLHLLLAHLAAAQGCPRGTAAHADSLAAFAPVAGAMTRALFRLPPHAFDLPGADLAARPAPGGAVYTGRMERDGENPLRQTLQSALSLRAGDTGPAAGALETGSGQAGGGDSSAAYVHAYLIAALAPRGGDTGDALRQLNRADSLASTRYYSSSPYLPRAISHLAAADLLLAGGRADAALARLDGIHEDLGFEVAYLAAVHQRKARLLRAAGDTQGALRETAAARQIWVGCRG